MTRYVTEHKGDPERVIRFIIQYCKVWDTVNNICVRNFFDKGFPDYYKYVYVYDDFTNVGVTPDYVPTDIYMYLLKK